MVKCIIIHVWHLYPRLIAAYLVMSSESQQLKETGLNSKQARKLYIPSGWEAPTSENNPLLFKQPSSVNKAAILRKWVLGLQQ